MQRTRYQFGPGGVVYIVCTALILSGALYTQANLLFWAFGLTMGGLVVSVFFSLIVLRRITMQRLAPAHGVVGRPLVLRYRVENRGWVPVFGLLVGETWPRQRSHRWRWRKERCDADPTGSDSPRLKAAPLGWALHLGPQQSVQAEAMCWPLRRGELRFEQVMVSNSFPFGVIRKVVTIEQQDRVLIYPKLYRVSRKVLYRAAMSDVSGRRQLDRPGGSDEFFGLRHYRSGDNLKMIDWKHSAKTGKLVSREMTQAAPPRIMLALDLRQMEPATSSEANASSTATPIDDTAVERAISLMASLVCDSYLNGYRIGLVVYGVECNAFAVHHSLPHRTRILEALAAIDTTRRTEAHVWSTQISVQPSVVVRPGASVAGGARHNGRIVIGTDDMGDFVIERDEDIETLLSKRAVTASRRQELAATSLS